MCRVAITETSSSSRTGAAGHLPPARLIDTAGAFEALCAELRGQPALALDTESDSLYRYHYRVCLIQLSTATDDYILDPLSLLDLSPLGALLADPAVEKVFHAADNDILVLKRDFGFAFARIFDTMIAARILGLRRVSLAALLADHYGVQLDKRAQLTDWGRRPLSSEQLSYAHLDSHYLLSLRDLLTEELKARGRWSEAQEAFAALPRVTYVEKRFDSEAFWGIKGARDLGPRELAVLRELYLWRDGRARSLDLPPFKVVDDRQLVRLSVAQPQTAGELGLSRYQAGHYGGELLEVIRRGQSAPPPHLPARTHANGFRPDPDALARYERLRVWRTQRATERGVDSDIVLTNDLLLAIARSAPASLEELAGLGLLGPWKLAEYGPELLRVLRE